ncbi:unnamed protein product [Closterium sp. Yama58-4]|nr:unnamed protein product [Closterium sp. Yama58-4]
MVRLFGMDWQLEKENIGPRTRDAVAKQALEAVNSGNIEEDYESEKRSLLEEMRNYNGDDPLDPWDRYIKLEISRSKTSEGTSELLDILKRCTETFLRAPLEEDRAAGGGALRGDGSSNGGDGRRASQRMGAGPQGPHDENTPPISDQNAFKRARRDSDSGSIEVFVDEELRSPSAARRMHRGLAGSGAKRRVLQPHVEVQRGQEGHADAAQERGRVEVGSREQASEAASASNTGPCQEQETSFEEQRYLYWLHHRNLPPPLYMNAAPLSTCPPTLEAHPNPTANPGPAVGDGSPECSLAAVDRADAGSDKQGTGGMRWGEDAGEETSGEDAESRECAQRSAVAEGGGSGGEGEGGERGAGKRGRRKRGSKGEGELEGSGLTGGLSELGMEEERVQGFRQMLEQHRGQAVAAGGADAGGGDGGAAGGGRVEENFLCFDHTVHAQGYHRHSEPLHVPARLKALRDGKAGEPVDLRLGSRSYEVDRLLGKGAYAKVYGATETPVGVADAATESTVVFRSVALKDVVNAFKRQGKPDVVNAFKRQGKPVPELLCAFYTAQMLRAVEALHAAHILHGDIKPDNFLLRFGADSESPREMVAAIEAGAPSTGVTLVDYGRSIDMRHFPEGSSFVSDSGTENFRCPEMVEGRPWTTQADLYAVCATAYCLLHGQYMEVERVPAGNASGDRAADLDGCADDTAANSEEDGGAYYRPRLQLKRYWNNDMWHALFHAYLNVPAGQPAPPPAPIRRRFERYSADHASDVSVLLRRLRNQL